MREEDMDDVLRVIELCRSVERSSANPFEVDIREKILLLRKHLPEWRFLDDLLLDSQALLELAQIVRLQDQWLKHRASSMYIDPLLIQFKVKLLSKEALAEAFIRSWHPLVQLDQLSPRGLEKAFTYWRDLAPMSERFRSEFGNYGVVPGSVDYGELLQLRIFTREQFEQRLESLLQELVERSKGEWTDYRAFIQAPSFEDTVVRAYLLAFLISEGKATMKTDPLTDQISVMVLSKKPMGPQKSVAVSITSES